MPKSPPPFEPFGPGHGPVTQATAFPHRQPDDPGAGGFRSPFINNAAAHATRRHLLEIAVITAAALGFSLGLLTGVVMAL